MNKGPEEVLPRLWSQLEPNSLSDVRRAANTELKRRNGQGVPSLTGSSVFKNGDDTLTAVISLAIARKGTPFVFDLNTQHPEIIRQPILPDSSAGIFAPGWDTAVDNNHLAAYGLGSPFPEDAKLCAALSGFWPGASPDATTTFNVTENDRIVAPMTDVEIKGDKRWDGVQGPTVVTIDSEEKVVYPNYPYIDYVINAENEKFSLAATVNVSTNEYIRRMLVMRKVQSELKQSIFANHKLLSFYRLPGKENRYHFEFANVDPEKKLAVPGNSRYWISKISQRIAVEINTDDESMTRLEPDPASSSMPNL